MLLCVALCPWPLHDRWGTLDHHHSGVSSRRSHFFVGCHTSHCLLYISLWLVVTDGPYYNGYCSGTEKIFWFFGGRGFPEIPPGVLLKKVEELGKLWINPDFYLRHSLLWIRLPLASGRLSLGAENSDGQFINKQKARSVQNCSVSNGFGKKNYFVDIRIITMEIFIYTYNASTCVWDMWQLLT